MTPDSAGHEVVLVEPEIPWNTGNVGRTCLGSQTPLHLVEPLAFDLSDKMVRRAGLDYWPHVDLRRHKTWADFLTYRNPSKPLWFFSRFATQDLWDCDLKESSYLVFGSETKGLPSSITDENPGRLVRIPTSDAIRSLNLSTAVAIGLFEGLRQSRGTKGS